MGDEPTKDDLYDRATELDISGRSKMSKEELSAAIEEAEGGPGEEDVELARREAVVAEHEEHRHRRDSTLSSA